MVSIIFLLDSTALDNINKIKTFFKVRFLKV